MSGFFWGEEGCSFFVHMCGRVKKEMLNGAEEWSKKLKHGGILKF